MATTLWPQVVDGLVAGMRATAGYQAPTSTGSGVPVYDSTDPGTTNQNDEKFLVIAWPGDPDSPAEAGTWEQTPGPMATTRPKDEAGTVECMAIAQNGDMNPKTVRDWAFAVVADVERLCRAQQVPCLGVQGVLWAFVRAGRFSPYMNEGATAELQFTVTYLARL